MDKAEHRRRPIGKGLRPVVACHSQAADATYAAGFLVV
jgi:hypothetical protein